MAEPSAQEGRSRRTPHCRRPPTFFTPPPFFCAPPSMHLYPGAHRGNAAKPRVSGERDWKEKKKEKFIKLQSHLQRIQTNSTRL